MWSWPVVYRMHKVFADSVVQLAVSFGAMVMFGDHDVVEAAHGFGLAFVECATSVPHNGRRIAMTPAYQQKLDEAQFSLRVFLLAARKDLNIPGRTEFASTNEVSAPASPKKWWRRQ